MKKVLLALVLSQSLVALAQVCVSWPPRDEATRQQVVQKLQDLKVDAVDCVSNPAAKYQYELWFYWLGGEAYAGATSYSVTYGFVPNQVQGSVTSRDQSYAFGGWTVTLRPKGSIWTVYRDETQTNLNSALKRLAKKMRRIAND